MRDGYLKIKFIKIFRDNTLNYREDFLTTESLKQHYVFKKFLKKFKIV